MSLTGTIACEGEKLYVRYETTKDSAPIRVVMFWRVQQVHRNPYAIGAYPAHGDVVTSNGDHWHGKGYSVTFPGGQRAERVTEEPVPCPPSRGKPTRWQNGRWERLMAKGWIPCSTGK